MSRKSRLRAVAKRRNKKGRRPGPRHPDRVQQEKDEMLQMIQKASIEEGPSKRRDRPIIERDPAVPSGGVDLLEAL